MTDHDAWPEIAGRLRAELGWGHRPPTVGCVWCGAEPGEACRSTGPRRNLRERRRIRSTPDNQHPSRTKHARGDHSACFRGVCPEAGAAS